MLQLITHLFYWSRSYHNNTTVTKIGTEGMLNYINCDSFKTFESGDQFFDALLSVNERVWSIF